MYKEKVINLFKVILDDEEIIKSVEEHLTEEDAKEFWETFNMRLTEETTEKIVQVSQENKSRLRKALKDGIYVTYECEDTNSLGIYYIPPEDLKLDGLSLKSKYNKFTLDEFNYRWSTDREALE